MIVGFTEPRGNRTGLGALQLADYVNGTLVYAGRAGTGFNETAAPSSMRLLDRSSRRDPPCLGPVVAPGAEPLPSEQIPETKTTTWVEPEYVCEVRFREWTPDGVLRHPAFLANAQRQAPQECERQGWHVPSEVQPARGA